MNRLYYYVSQGMHSEVKALIASGADVNGEVANLTPLDEAVNNNDVRMVQILTEAGANVNHGHPRTGNTALSSAVTKDIRIIEMLLQAGADVEGGKTKGTPLCFAAAFRKREAYDRLIAAGANPQAMMHGLAAREEIEKPSLSEESMKVHERMQAENQRPDRHADTIRQMMSHHPTAEEYAAHRGRGIYVFSLHQGVFNDPEVETWAKRLAEIIFTPGLLAQMEEKYLVGEELDAARRERNRLERWGARQAAKERRIAESNQAWES
ncbi:MAG: hypothetical protein WCK51_01600 [Armatimonadota bacterium]